MQPCWKVMASFWWVCDWYRPCKLGISSDPYVPWGTVGVSLLFTDIFHCGPGLVQHLYNMLQSLVEILVFARLSVYRQCPHSMWSRVCMHLLVVRPSVSAGAHTRCCSFAAVDAASWRYRSNAARHTAAWRVNAGSVTLSVYVVVNFEIVCVCVCAFNKASGKRCQRRCDDANPHLHGTERGGCWGIQSPIRQHQIWNGVSFDCTVVDPHVVNFVFCYWSNVPMNHFLTWMSLIN